MQQNKKLQGACHSRLASLGSGFRNGLRSRRRTQVYSTARSSTKSSSSSSGSGVRVDGLVVQPAYRSTPWEAEQQQALKPKDKALIMFVSESGICRAPLAAALFDDIVNSSPLKNWIEVQTRASRDYCVGQAPHPAAAAVAAAALGTTLTAAGAAAETDGGASSSSSSSGAVQFNPAADIVAADLVLVMDKYTAADVLREVSSYDLINPGGHYSSRVRLLGSFHPVLSQRTSQADAQDIDDPLYGNAGGEQEQVAVLLAAKLIHESCTALVQQLAGLATEHGLIADQPSNSQGDTAESTEDSTTSSSGAAVDQQHSGAVFRELLVQRIRQEGVISWLVPPMLQGSNTDLGGWV